MNYVCDEVRSKNCGCNQGKKVVIVSAIITLLLMDMLTKDGLELVGNMFQLVGTGLCTAEEALSSCK